MKEVVEIQPVKNRGLFEVSRIVYLDIGDISASLDTTRRDMAPGAMNDLVTSVSKYGVLQPVSVRHADSGYELISGERRLRAAKLAGLREIPCIIMDVSEQESAALVLVDNLQRRDLDFIEEARALSRLINLYGYSQDEAARLIGRSQPAVANKLRLLKLSDAITGRIRAAGLTERHARALLRLGGERAASAALDEIISRRLNVSQTDKYIDELTSEKTAQTKQGDSGAQAAPAPRNAPAPIPDENERSNPAITDGHLRFFINTVRRGIRLLQKAGVRARCDVSDHDDQLVITIGLPKGASTRP
jgi:ParB family chromosome partitioning protein